MYKIKNNEVIKLEISLYGLECDEVGCDDVACIGTATTRKPSRLGSTTEYF